MLSTAADALQLAQAAPWVAVSVLALASAAWVFRQSRRSVVASEARSQASAARQGKRLGDLEKRLGLVELRRQQVEWVLLDLGVALPFWPPDGPDQPRPRPVSGSATETEDEVLEELYTQEQRRVPVPPLPADVAARHRRP